MRVEALEFDDANEAECARHGVTVREIRQVLEHEPAFFQNKRPHRAQRIMVGPTYGGRFLTVPLAETPVEGVWRPATAWDSGDGERGRYRSAHGQTPGR